MPNRNDYYNVFGSLLEEDLGISRNDPQNATYLDNFINVREFECQLFCRSNSTKEFNYHKATEFQKKMWDMGVLYYTNYVIHNGLWGQKSGVNNDYQKSISQANIENSIMSSFAYKCFVQCGAITRKVQRGSWIL